MDPWHSEASLKKVIGIPGLCGYVWETYSWKSRAFQTAIASKRVSNNANVRVEKVTVDLIK
jgi:hypothetical protein